MSTESTYELLDELGRGGMGVVYKALDKSLNRMIAMKMLPKELKHDTKLMERFKREAMSAARLNHPNIVTVYSTGEFEDTPYIAMEFVDGHDLTHLINKEGRQEPRRAVEIVSQVADALAEAHSKSIIHRDIKPHNILLDINGRVKVTDFGLARAFREQSDLTAEGSRVGTPRYMSPEQVEDKPLSLRTDIYSLGVVLYELLAGKPAIQGNDTLAIMRQIVDGKLPKIKDLNANVPLPVSNIVAKMTAKNPDKRYASARKLKEELDIWLDKGIAPGAADFSDDKSPAVGTTALLPDEWKKAPEQKQRVAEFIVHYVEHDKTWAEWVNMVLTEGGYSTEMWEWDYKARHEALRRMNKALENGSVMLSVVSPVYLRSLHSERDWSLAFHQGTLKAMPVAVQQCYLGATFKTAKYVDLTELDQEGGKRAILDEAQDWRGSPSGSAPLSLDELLDSSGPTQLKHAIWNVPVDSHPSFAGRSETLTAIFNNLNTEHCTCTLVQTDSKNGGNGLTQAAVEYANLNKSHYAVIWWIRANKTAVMMNDIAMLANEIGLREKDSPKLSVIHKALQKWLAENPSWLLIFDDAPSYEYIQRVIPRRHEGHVLITSTNAKWPAKANAIAVGPLKRSESVDLLFSLTQERNEGAAAALAASLADNPLALNLAGAYVGATGTTTDQYIDLFIDRHKAIWGISDTPRNSRAIVTTVLNLTIEYLANRERDALHLVKPLAYLASTDIRLSLLCSAAKVFPRSLSKTLLNTARLQSARSCLEKFRLVHSHNDILEMHGMVQEIVCEWIEKDPDSVTNETYRRVLQTFQMQGRFERRGRTAWIKSVLDYLNAVTPERPQTKTNWSDYARLLPHTIVVLKHEQRLDVDPKLAVELWRRRGAYLAARADYDRANRAYRIALERAQKCYGDKHKEVSRLYKEMAHVYRAQSKHQDARTAYERALEIDQKIYGKAHEEIASTYLNLGNTAYNMGDLAGARQYYSRALETDKKVRGLRHADVGRDYTYLGLVAQDLGDLTAAWEYHGQALEISEEAYGEEHERVSAAVKNRAGLLQKMGDYAKAREMYKRALDIDTKIHGSHHPDVAQDHNNLGIVQEALGFVREAQTSYQKALMIDEAVYGSRHPKVALKKNNLANILRGQGDLQQAKKYYKEAARTLHDILGPNHEHTQTAMRNLDRVRAQIKQEESGPKAGAEA